MQFTWVVAQLDILTKFTSAHSGVVSILWVSSATTCGRRVQHQRSLHIMFRFHLASHSGPRYMQTSTIHVHTPLNERQRGWTPRAAIDLYVRIIIIRTCTCTCPRRARRRATTTWVQRSVNKLLLQQQRWKWRRSTRQWCALPAKFLCLKGLQSLWTEG